MPFEKNKAILEGLFKFSNEKSEITEIRPATGGSINRSYNFSYGTRKYFIKENSATLFPEMFMKEQNGLNELKKCNALVIPEPVCVIITEEKQFLILEYLEKKVSNGAFFEGLGSGLAALHQIKGKQFGFKENNYLGSEPQLNSFCDSWEVFFSEQRLHPLVKWCYDQKLISSGILRSFENLYKKLNSIFPKDEPCLLHGDLWNGNVMNTTKGPSIYDPAVYYGHREMDIAMTRLFGGFDEGFYTSYGQIFPLEKSYKERTDICNLYPLLVHVKLFGGGYLSEVLSIIKKH